MSFVDRVEKGFNRAGGHRIPSLHNHIITDLLPDPYPPLLDVLSSFEASPTWDNLWLVIIKICRVLLNKYYPSSTAGFIVVIIIFLIPNGIEWSNQEEHRPKGTLCRMANDAFHFRQRLVCLIIFILGLAVAHSRYLDVSHLRHTCRILRLTGQEELVGLALWWFQYLGIVLLLLAAGVLHEDGLEAVYWSHLLVDDDKYRMCRIPKGTGDGFWAQWEDLAEYNRQYRACHENHPELMVMSSNSVTLLSVYQWRGEYRTKLVAEKGEEVVAAAEATATQFIRQRVPSAA